MESISTIGESLPTPPPYVLSDGCKTVKDVRVHQINSLYSPPPPFPSFSSPLPVPATLSPSPRPVCVSYETELLCSPALTTCTFCQTRVTTQVTFHVGTYAWLMCLVFALCGLILGCCLIPFFMNHFKDAYHTCPCCQQVLHVHKKTWKD